MATRFSLLSLCLPALIACPVQAVERIAGPVAASVERVVDGDTLVVEARIWLGIAVTTHVRIRGIDTPEVHRPQCDYERTMGLQATAKLMSLAGDAVVLADIENDKYGGRVDATVRTPAGIDIAEAMIASGLARPYDGSARGDWCATGSID